jgi:hypothetical protein
MYGTGWGTWVDTAFNTTAATIIYTSLPSNYMLYYNDTKEPSERRETCTDNRITYIQLKKE